MFLSVVKKTMDVKDSFPTAEEGHLTLVSSCAEEQAYESRSLLDAEICRIKIGVNARLRITGEDTTACPVEVRVSG